MNWHREDQTMAIGNTLDGKSIRAMLFDPAVPDYAFLTRDEVIAAFDTSEPTLRRWALESGFPDPVAYPGITAYPIAALREFLSRVARESRNATSKKTVSLLFFVGGSFGGSFDIKASTTVAMP